MDKIIPIFDRSIPIDEVTEVHFQSLSWNEGDFEKEDSETLQYVIYISGVNKLGQSVCVKVLGFTPYFYVLVPDSWMKTQAELFYKHMKSKLWTNGYGLIGFDLVKRKKIYPYLAGKQFKFIRLIFNTDKAFNICKWMFARKKQEEKPIKISGIDDIPYYEAFETNIKHLNRFCHIRGIETTGWIKVKKYQEDLQYSSAQINITTNWKNIFHDPDTKIIAPLSIYSWDIECRPENTEEFPNPEIEGDIIKQISVVLVKYGTPLLQRFIFTSSPCSSIKYCKTCGIAAKKYQQISCEHINKCSKKCNSMCNSEHICGSIEWEDAVVIESEGEKKLLEKFCDFISVTDPDIIIGFNTWGFDDNYFWKRILMHDIDVSKLSRINDLQPKLIKKELSSSAYGNNEFNYLFCPGRETFDMLVAIRREHKLESTSLKFVSNHFLKKKKVDLDIRILFEKLNGGPDEIAECAVYCIGDSERTIELFLKLNMLPNYVEMAKATFVPMEWLLFRGQQCKVFSLIAKKAREDKYVIPVHEKTVKGPKFKGATVIDPMIGMYFEPIAGLDFASLYPSIMMAYNMCYSTIIISSDMMDYVIKNNIPYKTIEWEECTESECKNPKCYHEKIKFSFSFVQIEDEKGIEIINGTRGILGTILLTLMQSRTATKKLMKGEKDPFMYAVLNGKQLAIKVSMNSVYGFTGAEEGIFPCKPIAAGTTAVGREMIEKTSKMTGEEFGGLTIYGDSIFSHELITISFGEITKDIPVEHFSNELSEKWEEYRGFKIGDITVMNKEYKNLENNEYYTLTHKGYQKIKKVIRHKVKGKKMYKITAKDKLGNLHSVSVTEGHSLIGENEELIVAENLKIGDKLYDYQKKKPL